MSRRDCRNASWKTGSTGCGTSTAFRQARATLKRVSENAGIEPSTFATSADALTTRLYRSHRDITVDHATTEEMVCRKERPDQRIFPLLVSSPSSRRIGDSNSCPPDPESGVLTKWLASRLLVWVSAGFSTVGTNMGGYEPHRLLQWLQIDIKINLGLFKS